MLPGCCGANPVSAGHIPRALCRVISGSSCGNRPPWRARPSPGESLLPPGALQMPQQSWGNSPQLSRGAGARGPQCHAWPLPLWRDSHRITSVRHVALPWHLRVQLALSWGGLRGQAASVCIAVSKVMSQMRVPTGKRHPVSSGMLTPGQEPAQPHSQHIPRGAPGAPMVPWEVAAGSQIHLHAGPSQQGERHPALQAVAQEDPAPGDLGGPGVSLEHNMSLDGCTVPAVLGAGTWHPGMIPSPTCQGLNPP